MKDIQNNQEIPIPEGMEERLSALIDRLEAEEKGRKAKRVVRLAPYVAAVAACILLLLVFHFSKEPAEEKPVVAEVLAEPKDNVREDTTGDVEKRDTSRLPTTHVAIANDTRRVDQHDASRQVTQRQTKKDIAQATAPATAQQNETQEASEEKAPSQEVASSELTEAAPVVSADMQALADIFLAEEALQVAYEMQAQREAIRAYAASLMGVEPVKPVIAF